MKDSMKSMRAMLEDKRRVLDQFEFTINKLERLIAEEESERARRDAAGDPALS
jgi:hypothetical protein